MTNKKKAELSESMLTMDADALEALLKKVEENDPDHDIIAEIKERIAQAKDQKVEVEALKDTTIDGKMLSKGQKATIRLQQYKALAARLKILSKIKCIAVLLTLSLLMLGIGATSVQAQAYGPRTVEGGTNGLAAATAGTPFVDTVNTNLITVTKSRFLALQISFTNSSVCAFSSNVVFSFSKSLDGYPDGTNTANNLNITVPSRTDNNYRAQLTTNIDLGAIGYLTLVCRTNYCTNSPTNIVIKVQDGSPKP